MPPLTAPVGTVAVICVSELTVKLVASTPPNDTALAPVKLSPVMTMEVLTGPLVGKKLKTCGVTLKATLLESVPLGVVTRIEPVDAPAGTVVVISEANTTVNAAGVPLKLTAVLPVRLFPRRMTGAPTVPDPGCASTNGLNPTVRLKTDPCWVAPPKTAVP